MSEANRGPKPSFGVLLMAYGGPSSLAEVPAYLADVRGGRPSPPGFVEELVERYRRIGGASPLARITAAQATALGAELAGRGRSAVVRVGMRHSEPRIRRAVAEFAADEVDTVVALPLTPYRSRLSIGQYTAALRAAVAAEESAFLVVEPRPWHDHPLLIETYATALRKALAGLPVGSPTSVVFTAHSLPARILKDGDPYESDLKGAAAEVARTCGLGTWRFAYQSRSPSGEPWLGPDAREVLAEELSRGAKAMALCPIGFVSDHLETLYDADILYREVVEAKGARFARAAAPNTEPVFIRCLADVALSALGA